MTSMNDLHRLIEILTRHRMPKEQIIWLEIEQYIKWMNVLKNLGSAGAVTTTLPNSNPPMECITMKYGQFVFYIIQY